MTYNLEFVKPALKEWVKLDDNIKKILKKKLQDRLQNPVIESARVHGIKDCYKIKLRQTGYRLVYKVIKKEVVILVVAVGKRERNAAYKLASKRI
jgi:mRNA interferase RelE/StbE